MATSTRAAMFWLMTATITVTIATGFLQVSPPPVFPSAGSDESDNPYVNTLLWCLQHKHIMPFPKGPFSSYEEHRKAWHCRDMFLAVGYEHELSGRLPSYYVEALRLLRGKNQAAVDNHNHIRRLSLQQRRWNETAALPRRFSLH